jgi:hypothetical protein
MFKKSLIALCTLCAATASALPCTCITPTYVTCVDPNAPQQVIWVNVVSAYTINIRQNPGNNFTVFLVSNDGTSYDVIPQFPDYNSAVNFINSIAAVLSPI